MNYAPWHDYNLRGEYYFNSYEQLAFDRIHRSFLRFLPRKGSNCLDVGSGSGRDAIGLAKRGYKVVAVEPSEVLLRLAKIHHPSEQITWVKDHLPCLNEARLLGQKYDFILLSAVWMHVYPDDRMRSLGTLTSLLTEKGLIAMTVRLGPDQEERMMFSTRIEDLLSQAETHGLHAIYLSRETKDFLNRPDVRWKKIIFARK